MPAPPTGRQLDRRAVTPPVPGANTAQSAQNLAAWIRDHSGG